MSRKVKLAFCVLAAVIVVQAGGIFFLWSNLRKAREIADKEELRAGKWIALAGEWEARFHELEVKLQHAQLREAELLKIRRRKK